MHTYILMNYCKKYLVLFVTLIMLIGSALPMCAQHNIEQLLPEFSRNEDVDMMEVYSKNVILLEDLVQYTCIIRDTPLNRVPRWLQDSITVAFERELPVATESDRYQRHTDTGDTLSYSLAYKGKILPDDSKAPALGGPNKSFNMNIITAASLDICDSTLTLFYAKTTPVEKNVKSGSSEDSCPREAMVEMLQHLTSMSQVKTTPVSYNIANGDFFGSWALEFHPKDVTAVHRRGIRYEIPSTIADSIYSKATALINAMTMTESSYDCFMKINDQSIALGKDMCDDAFLARRIPDGRVFLLHMLPDEKHSGSLVPMDWHQIDKINRK